MKGGGSLLILISSFLAFSEAITVIRAIRSGRAPTGITPLGWARPDEVFVSKTGNAGRYWREVAARSALVAFFSAMIVFFIVRG